MNPHGIRAWLPPVYGPKRRYEAPTCVRSPRVYADTMTAIQVRHALASMIDPKHIVSGWMPRRVRVTDDDGNVVREMTAEQLGVKLIARGAVEFAVDGRAIPSTVCPSCGERKANRSASACARCAGNFRRPVCLVCPKCGGRKTRQASTCLPCRRSPENTCGCGAKKSLASRCCKACAGQLPKPDRFVCSCGRRKSELAIKCRSCVDSERVDASALERAMTMYANGGVSMRKCADSCGVKLTTLWERLKAAPSVAAP